MANKDILIPSRWLGEFKDKVLQIRNNSISLAAWLAENFNITVPIKENFLRYAKDETITDEQIGLLAMHSLTPLEYTGNAVLVTTSVLTIVINNVQDGTFAADDTISDGEDIEGTVLTVTDLGEGTFEITYEIVTGSFSESTSITNGTATADVAYVPVNVLEVGQYVIAYNADDEQICELEVITVEDNIVTVTPTSVVEGLGSVVRVILQGEGPPQAIAYINSEASTFPSIIGGEDIATLCQTSSVGEGVTTVANMVLGEIVGIDGDEVLINCDLTQKVVLSEDNAVTVYNTTTQRPNYLLAWDDGKVITSGHLSEILNNAETEDYIIKNALLTGGLFTAISTGDADNEDKTVVKAVKAFYVPDLIEE